MRALAENDARSETAKTFERRVHVQLPGMKVWGPQRGWEVSVTSVSGPLWNGGPFNFSAGCVNHIDLFLCYAPSQFNS